MTIQKDVVGNSDSEPQDSVQICMRYRNGLLHSVFGPRFVLISPSGEVSEAEKFHLQAAMRVGQLWWDVVCLELDEMHSTGNFGLSFRPNLGPMVEDHLVFFKPGSRQKAIEYLQERGKRSCYTVSVAVSSPVLGDLGNGNSWDGENSWR